VILIVGDLFLDVCEQNFIKACPVFDGYEAAIASNLEKMIRIFANVMD